MTALTIRPGHYIAPLRDVGSTTPTRRIERPAVSRPWPQGWSECEPGVWQLGGYPLASVRVSLIPGDLAVTVEVARHEPLSSMVYITRALADLCAWLDAGVAR